MRVQDESSLSVTVAGQRLHLVVGSPREGTVRGFLMSENTTIATYVILLDLTGHLLQAQFLVDDRNNDPVVLAALRDVDPAIWRVGLSTGMRRRLTALESLGPQPTSGTESPTGALARLRAHLAAVECDDPSLRVVMSSLASTWTGTVDELTEAARQALTDS
jgi:hypothetical protein